MKLAGAVLAVATALLPAIRAQDEPPAPASAPAPAAPRPAWTFAIYAAIDNSAEEDGNFFEFLDGVRAAYADNPDVELILFADRSPDYSRNATSLGEDFEDARLYRVRSGACERLDGGPQFPEITTSSRFEPDSADPETLRKFLAFVAAQHPARYQALMLYGHADGRAMCPDEGSEHEMGFAQLTDVVPAELSVDLTALELCNMGGIEIAYQWSPMQAGFSTHFLVAIPNAGPPLDWGRVFARLRAPGAAGTTLAATLTPGQLGELIVEEGGNGRRARDESFESVACYDLSQAGAVKQAVDAFAVQLAGSDSRSALGRARGPGPDGFVLNYAQDRIDQDPFVDLHDLATRAVKSDALSDAAREAAQAVARAVDGFVAASYGGSGLPRFQAGKSGVYITFPVGPDVNWKRCRWYTPLSVTGVYGQLAWCRDGAVAGDGVVQNWFELLDSWLDTPGPDEGVNGYAY